jgi:hypothetical protein
MTMEERLADARKLEGELLLGADGAPGLLDVDTRTRAHERRSTQLSRAWERLERTEDLLGGEGNPTADPGVARRALQAEGLSRVHASRYVAAVYDRWATEAKRMGRDQKRQGFIAALRHVVSVALARQGAVGGPDGPSFFANPDSGAAVRAIELMARLDGALEPNEAPVINVSVDARKQVVLALQQHYHGGEAATAIEALGDGEGGENR